MERERSPSASSTDSWSVIDHRRSSSCDDSENEEDSQSMDLCMDDDKIEIAEEAFEPSSDDEVTDDGSDIEVDSHIEVDYSDDEEEEKEDDDEHQEEEKEPEWTDDEEEDETEMGEIEQEEEAESDEDYSEDSDEYENEEEEEESVWVDRDDVKDGGGLYFECPEHIKTSFDEIDRREGWKLAARVIIFYFGIVAVSMTVQSGLRVYKIHDMHLNVPALTKDIYGLQYRRANVNAENLSQCPSIPVYRIKDCKYNESRIRRKQRYQFLQSVHRFAKSSTPQMKKKLNSEKTTVFPSHTVNQTYLKNKSRFRVLSNIVQKSRQALLRPNVLPHKIQKAIQSAPVCNLDDFKLGQNKTSGFCPRLSPKLSVPIPPPRLRRAPSLRALPQVRRAASKNICVKPRSVPRSPRSDRPQKNMSPKAQTLPVRPRSKLSFRKSSFFPIPPPRTRRAPKFDYRPFVHPAPRVVRMRSETRQANRKMLVAPPPRVSNMSRRYTKLVTSLPSATRTKPSPQPPSRLSFFERRKRMNNQSVCIQETPKPSKSRKPHPPHLYKAPKPVRYSVGPALQKSSSPCFTNDVPMPSVESRATDFFHDSSSYLSSMELLWKQLSVNDDVCAYHMANVSSPISAMICMLKDTMKASSVLHNLSIKKKKDQCDGKTFKSERIPSVMQKKKNQRKAIDHKPPVPCAAHYKLESSVIARQPSHIAERRSIKMKSHHYARNSSVIKFANKKKTLLPSKKTMESKCRAEHKPKKQEWKVKPRSSQLRKQSRAFVF